MVFDGDKTDVAALVAYAQSLEQKNDILRTMVVRAAGRLAWCAKANPGCAVDGGRKLAQEWSEELQRDLKE